ncbi:hypothetical protein VL06_01215 [Rossellomorea marisflavi]|nr:hypothetical protein VL06_01215 [Rossellomorea marisflavi]
MRGDVLIGNRKNRHPDVVKKVWWGRDRFVSLRPPAFHGACGELLRLRLQGLTLPAFPIGVGRPSLHFTLSGGGGCAGSEQGIAILFFL